MSDSKPEYLPRIKFCGLTRRGDAEICLQVGAWAVGMVFYPDSPRCCSNTAATEIVSSVGKQVETCGVFVNASLADITSTYEEVGFSMVQLHGDEGPAYCAEIKRRTGVKIIKAARLRIGADLRVLGAFRTDYHLVDSYIDGKPGGTGQTLDWSAILRSKRKVPLILSGGLTAENVQTAIRKVSPFAVDVASGVEFAPGIKDKQKLIDFSLAVRRSLSVSAT